MMTGVMELIVVVVLVGMTQGYYTDDVDSGSGETEIKCTMSEWSEWGPCVRSPACPRHVIPEQRAHSFSMHASRGFDFGRKHMMRMTEQKRRQWRDREACAEEHTCPELDSRTSESTKACVNGTAGIYPCRNIDMLAYVGMKDLTGGIKLKQGGDVRGNDIWGWIDPKTNDEYAIMGTTHGTSFVRITDPEHPQVVAFLQTRTTRSIWRDIKVVSNVAYIGAEAWGHGMQVFDLTRLRQMKTFKEVTSDFDYKEIGNSHNIVSNEDSKFIYIVGDRQRGYDNGCKGGLHMVDVSEPLKPKFVGCFDGDGYTHDAQCILYRDGPDSSYIGHEVCFAYNEDSLTIVDVTDKNNPDIIAKIGYEGTQYTHQGWVTEDRKLLLMDDELDEIYSHSDAGKYTRTLVWDISYLRAPKLLTSFWSHVQAIDHNQYIRGNFAYQSNYEAGLRMLHLKPDSHSLKEIAYFDVYPSRTAARFGGTWSNYPYYNSDVVAVSSIEYGLFILKPNRDAIKEAVEKKDPYAERIRMRSISSAHNPSDCPPQVETRLCTPKDCP